MSNNLDCDRLTAIARHFTGRDDIVVEEHAHIVGAWGVATHDTAKPVIRLRSSMAANVPWLLEVFAHEIAHHARGHIPDLEPNKDWWAVTRNLVKAHVVRAITPTDEKERQAIETGGALESRIQAYCQQRYGRTFGRAVVKW